MRRGTQRLLHGGWIAPVAWLAATAVVVAAIFQDHEWKADNKDAGISLALVVLLLLLIALAHRGTRRLLRDLKVFKLAGVELEFQAQSHQVQAIADLVQRGSGAEEELGDDEPRILATFDTAEAGASLEQLRDKLDERLGWIYQRLPGLGRRPLSDRAAVADLRAQGLLPDDASKNLDTLLTIDDATVDELRRRQPQDLRLFLRQTDQLVHRLRLVVLDTKVRAVCRAEHFELIDWGPQPPGRWPDFIANRVVGGTALSWWVSVRMAQVPQSKLYASTTKRLSGTATRLEVPGGADVRALVVLPPESESIQGDGPVVVSESPKVLAVRLPELVRTLRS